TVSGSSGSNLEAGSPPQRCLSEMPVPGMDAVACVPRGPTLTAPPTLRLSPLFDRFSLTPGIILNECRKRQLIHVLGLSSSARASGLWPPVPAVHPAIAIVLCACRSPPASNMVGWV